MLYGLTSGHTASPEPWAWSWPAVSLFIQDMIPLQFVPQCGIFICIVTQKTRKLWARTHPAPSKTKKDENVTKNFEGPLRYIKLFGLSIANQSIPTTPSLPNTLGKLLLLKSFQPSETRSGSDRHLNLPVTCLLLKVITNARLF